MNATTGLRDLFRCYGSPRAVRNTLHENTHLHNWFANLPSPATATLRATGTTVVENIVCLSVRPIHQLRYWLLPRNL